MAQLTQVSGGSWTANKPVMVGKDTQTKQRLLKAKIVKAINGRQYIKDPCCAQGGLAEQ